LVAGVSYPTGRVSGGHIETSVEGWIPASATQPTTRDGFDLTVVADGGSVLRGAPGGSAIAQLQEGTLLSRLGARGTWLRVRRSGWVTRGSLTQADPSASQPAARPPPAATRDQPAAEPAPARAPPPPPPPPTAPAAGDSQPVTQITGTATLRSGTAIAATPDGQSLLNVASNAEVEVMERTRDWVRVRLDGWVKTGDLAGEVLAGPRITGAMIREQPERFVGQTVTWRIQFLAVQEADALRPEMPRGQPYLLARGPLPESGFVYLMVTKEQAAQLAGLAPLDELRVEAIIRAGRTRYLPTPVLELVGVVR
jgi:hypothetical protein